MNVFVLLSVLISTSALAQVTDRAGESYNEFSAAIKVTNGETKNLVFKINTQVRVDRFGDPEIPSHGHYDYVLTGSLVEQGKSCKFEALLTQGDGEAMSTDEIRASGKDRSDTIRLCSGLTLTIQSVRALLITGDSRAILSAAGLSLPIGEGVIRYITRRTVEEPACSDPWHCGPDYIGPRR
jgi:hypothetical protein